MARHEPVRPTPGSRGAVVTGGAGGIGTAVSRRLAEAGYHVWVADLDRSAAEVVARDIGPSATPIALDVADAAAAAALAKEVAAEAGLAVWVNNAGVLRTGPSWGHDPREIDTMFSVNTLGTINGTRAALAVMRPAGRGHIVNIVSLAGLVAPPGETVYAATKHAALAYTTGTALDLRQHGQRGVHLTAMCPDGVWTPMLHDLVDDPEAAPSWSGVLLEPDQVAQAVAAVLERPRPLVSIPRWRGALARVYALSPRFALAAVPLVMADARRKQRRFRRRLAAGGSSRR